MKSLVWLGVIVGFFVGFFVSTLWGIELFSISSLALGCVGMLIGAWIGSSLN